MAMTMPVLASTALISCSMRWEIRSNSAGSVTVLIICNRLTIPNSLQGNKYVVDSLRSPVRLLLLEATDRVVRECDAVYLSIGRGRHGMGRTRVALANQEVSSSPGRRRDDRRIQHHRRILDASLSRNDANDTGERRRSPNGALHGSVL